MAKQVTIKIDQSAGQIAIADGTLFLGEAAPIKFTGCTLASGETIRLTLFAKDGTTAIADNSTNSSLLDLRTELVKKAFHSEQVDHAFLAYAFSVNSSGERTGTMDARGIIPIAWSPAIMTSQGTIGLYKGDKGDRGDHGGVDPRAVAREFSLSDTYSVNEIAFTYRNNDDTTQIVFYRPVRFNNEGTIKGVPVTDEKYWVEFPLSSVYVLLANYDQIQLDSFPSTDPLYIYDTLINGSTLLQWFDLTGNEVNQEAYGNGDWYNTIDGEVEDVKIWIKKHEEASNPHEVTLEQIGGATTNEIDALISELGNVRTVNYAGGANIMLVANADTATANVFALPIQGDVVTDTVYNIPPINIPQISFSELDMYEANSTHILGIATKTKDTINFETTAADGTKIVSTLEPSSIPSNFILTELDLEIVHLFMTKEDLAMLQYRVASLNETLESVA